jgi:hypothetical protein
VLVAVTVTVFGVGKLAGAVYIPFASIVPTVAFPPAVEFTDHVTLLLVLALLLALPLTVAAKASFAPARIVAVAGVTVTLFALPLSGGSVEPSLPRFVPSPEQPLSNNIRSTACVLQNRFTDMSPPDLGDNSSPQRPQHQRCCRWRFAFQLLVRIWALLLG